MTILSQFRVEEFIASIKQKNKQELTKINGIGDKIASRLIYELNDTNAILKISNINTTINEKLIDAKSALMHLGYASSEIERVIDEIKEDKSLEELIKISIQKLSI